MEAVEPGGGVAFYSSLSEVVRFLGLCSPQLVQAATPGSLSGPGASPRPLTAQESPPSSSSPQSLLPPSPSPTPPLATIQIGIPVDFFMGDLDDTSAASFDFLLARLALENGTGSGHVLASKGLLQRRLDRAYSFRPEGMALDVAKARFIASRVQVVGLIWECLGRLGIPCDAPHAPRVLVMDVVHPRASCSTRTPVGGPIVVAKANGGAAEAPWSTAE